MSGFVSRWVVAQRHDVDPNVVVSAGVTEVRPHAFTMAIRVRSFGGREDGLVNAACEITLEDQSGAACEIDDDVRDELIALELRPPHRLMR
jgi:hypothetical protein